MFLDQCLYEIDLNDPFCQVFKCINSELDCSDISIRDSYIRLIILMHKDEPRWVIAPLDKGLDVPFLKAFPLKALDNEQVEYEAETSKGKINLEINIRDTF